MGIPSVDRIRAATAADAAQLIFLWSLLFNEDDTDPRTAWKKHAQGWFTRFVEDRTTARFPVIEVNGDIVATAIGTLELGVPNPQCPQGRTVRLANVITLPKHRGRGYGTLLVRDVIQWARSIKADRVDLSATPDGQRIYEQAGFHLTKAPRMKLVL
jgi:GNAT superfamily N-acetyltransferase